MRKNIIAQPQSPEFCIHLAWSAVDPVPPLEYGLHTAATFARAKPPCVASPEAKPSGNHPPTGLAQKTIHEAHSVKAELVYIKPTVCEKAALAPLAWEGAASAAFMDQLASCIASLPACC